MQTSGPTSWNTDSACLEGGQESILLITVSTDQLLRPTALTSVRGSQETEIVVSRINVLGQAVRFPLINTAFSPRLSTTAEPPSVKFCCVLGVELAWMQDCVSFRASVGSWDVGRLHLYRELGDGALGFGVDFLIFKPLYASYAHLGVVSRPEFHIACMQPKSWCRPNRMKSAPWFPHCFLLEWRCHGRRGGGWVALWK